MIPDGVKGADGALCCPVVKCNFILPLDGLNAGTVPPGTDVNVSTTDGLVKIHFATSQEIFQHRGVNLNPQYQILANGSQRAISVTQGWIEIWTDKLGCDAKLDSALVFVQNAPAYSSSFNASGQTLYDAPPANANGAFTFGVTCATEDRIGYQVIWTPGLFILIELRIN